MSKARVTVSNKAGSCCCVEQGWLVSPCPTRLARVAVSNKAGSCRFVQQGWLVSPCPTRLARVAVSNKAGSCYSGTPGTQVHISWS